MDPSDPRDPVPYSGGLSAEVVRAQLQALEADAAGFAERLQTARGWEVATMEARPAIVERLLALA